MARQNRVEIVEGDSDLPGLVGDEHFKMPSGYKYGVTRYADLILRDAFPGKFQDIVDNLTEYYIDYEQDIVAGGGSRARHTKRHDEGLVKRGWRTHNVTIEKLVDGKSIFRVRGHEIDVFTKGDDGDYPGISVEMEWNNKDPFYHRDLSNFQALHREGVIAVGVIVTRGPRLQRLLKFLGNKGQYSNTKYGEATTHWNKLIPMINMGAGGECPLLCIGIEPERVKGFPAHLLDEYDRF